MATSAPGLDAHIRSAHQVAGVLPLGVVPVIVSIERLADYPASE